jgi:hypothetical protein
LTISTPLSITLYLAPLGVLTTTFFYTLTTTTKLFWLYISLGDTSLILISTSNWIMFRPFVGLNLALCSSN